MVKTDWCLNGAFLLSYTLYNQRESGIDPLTFQLVDELIAFLIKCSVDVHMWL